VRVARLEDEARARDLFDRLSAESRYLRWARSVGEPPTEWIAGLAHSDGVDDLVVVAFMSDEPSRLAGLARYMRCADRPDGAEIEIVVADTHHRRGVGTALMELIVDAARAAGFGVVVANVLAVNQGALALVRRLDPQAAPRPDASTVEFTIDLLDRPPFRRAGLIARTRAA
jgi:GNAT superfamily N-acetyltransferase